MKNFFAFLFLFVSASNYAQIKGTVIDDKGNPLAFVNIFEENTYNGMTSIQLRAKEIKFE